jgi:hypothetical protein
MDRARDELLAGTGLAFDQDGDRRGGRALHQPEDFGHRGAGADDLGETIASREVATQHADLRAQALLGRLHLLVQARVLDRDGDAGCERVEECEVVVGERPSAAPVHDLDDADHAVTRAERRREEAAGPYAGLPVDVRVRPGSVRVVGPDP